MAVLEFEKPLVELERRIESLKSVAGSSGDFSREIDRLEHKARRLQEEIFRDLSVWQKVQLCRHPDRPYTLDYVERIFDDFVELHGDRTFGDDAAIVGGFGALRIPGMPRGPTVMVVGHQKGRNTKENVVRNFGMPNPEGYRKARRLFELADRFRRPILTLIDTPGAYPGIGAEERGQSEAIGQCLLTLARVRVPVIATVIGEGGSGGALALGVANRVLMLEHSTYSVISPEGCASILWKDQAAAAEAAAQLKLTATDILRFGIADDIVEEPPGGAHRAHDDAANRLAAALRANLEPLMRESPGRLVEQRYAKFRAIGAPTDQ
ncbi:MAG: acetyl-CoA carboxylase carboxyltransferase subunit alpha [Deltaproteobacteria bacterium]|nr:acetyl-CoA carboxylase carboxyltransferase subunit alpha [Deltaproteobacteria bacterium]